jgi:hypothetical protein
MYLSLLKQKNFFFRIKSKLTIKETSVSRNESVEVSFFLDTKMVSICPGYVPLGSSMSL